MSRAFLNHPTKILGIYSRGNYSTHDVKLHFLPIFVKKEMVRNFNRPSSELLFKDRFGLSESESSGGDKEGTYACQGKKTVDSDAVAA